MARNIIIFSDGTGQAGGIHFDEKRSNIYKMYRAMRCGPDTKVDPKTQAAFYDPGLGSPLDGGALYRGPFRTFYNVVSQATGWGITANIIDCYAALIRLWQPGDRIFLFGFSRGAYTVRLLSGVLRYCGVPTKMPDGSPVPIDPLGSRRLAEHAVKHVYQFTTSRRKKVATDRQKFLMETRRLIAAKFREEHGCAHPDRPDRPNVVPYFIGVFDTVASLIDRQKLVGLGLVGFAALVLVSLLASWWFGTSVVGMAALVFGLALVFGGLAYLRTHLKYDFAVPGYDFATGLKTIHLSDAYLNFEDKTLDPYVPYAKHALSIDENRGPFARVGWYQDGQSPYSGRDGYGNTFFEQVWFSGVHSDVGGSYAEDESRLSDIPLQWMVECATWVPDGLAYDKDLLQLYPDPEGFQHDARKQGFGILTRWFGITYPLGYREPVADAILHPTVYDRFDAERVAIYDRREPYRPPALKQHKDVAALYTELETKSDERLLALRNCACDLPKPPPETPT